ncbi:serine/threonine-protein kinase [Amycolatopsis sp. YIM 10]|uniref:serine/threonine-protein kinase n=1 Tax=Amycolatopsis sp. YIM 10 TaxID=2653857 RepID=UPI0012A88625|nr:serine/threonine-protein kinase [Amycolatopsis sp. YIM 10]QFU85902.1 Serine/threonine-protein kinase PknE [Amycolatopsis sp. YIM 10]
MTGDVSGDLTGRRLGNYRIDGVLGKGGMSVMYRATDVRLGRKVALKVIGEHLGADAEFRERFVDEARSTSAIDHANVVPLYDFGELDGMLYIAMRLVDGKDLAGLINGAPMAPERALGLLEQVADALDTLHDRGLVHLDVKPANVLVTSRESAREHVYVADFGLTRRGATGHRTRGGDFLGSPTYAAPEHLRGEPLDGRTDQYALACVLYACLTGSPPFKGDVPAVIKGHLQGEPPSVSRVVSLPTAVDAVIRKGMAKSAGDRYGSCVELIAAARRAMETAQPAAAGPPSQPVPAGPPSQPQPVAVSSPAQQSAPQRPQGEGARMHPYGQGGPQQPQQQPPPGYGPPPQGMPPQQQGMPPQGMPPQGYGAPPPGYGQPNMPPQGMPPQGMPPQGMPPQGPPPGYGPPPGDPMRLRPPSPAGGSPWEEKKSGGKAWLIWLIVGLVVVAGGIVLVLVLTRGDDSAGTNTPTDRGTNQPAPSIPVGEGPATGQPGETGGNKPPPTSIPIKPGG